LTPQTVALQFLERSAGGELPDLSFKPEPSVNTMDDDGITSERQIQGNDIVLIWAPEGPGWRIAATKPLSWRQAMNLVSRLSADGTHLEDQPINF
jgi:hypothetical protein